MASRQQAIDQRLPAYQTVMRIVHRVPASVGVMPVPGDGWALKINLVDASGMDDLPDHFEGVPAFYYVTGEARLLGSTRRPLRDTGTTG